MLSHCGLIYFHIHVIFLKILESIFVFSQKESYLDSEIQKIKLLFDMCLVLF